MPVPQPLFVPLAHVEDDPVLFIEPNAPNGENLPQGIRLYQSSLSPVLRKTVTLYFEPISESRHNFVREVFVINGFPIFKKSICV